MKIQWKNSRVEYILRVLDVAIAAVIIATFVMLYGYNNPLMPIRILHGMQVFSFLALLAMLLLRFFNAEYKKQFLRSKWFELPALLILAIFLTGASTWMHLERPGHAVMMALGIYLMFETVAKSCQATINLAATGQNPAIFLISIFLVLIFAGAGMLMLPRSYTSGSMSFVDALFTSTSAACVTGLIVKDTGSDFTLLGQTVILTLIQLGGLGIVIFGAVIALLLGRAFSVRETVAMQDLLNTQTLGQIGKMIAFIFTFTIVIEGVAAVLMYPMWNDAGGVSAPAHPWFTSVFHAISAFCNAGFSLYSDSLIPFSRSWQVYGVICPLIIIGGLGFGVLYNLLQLTADRIQRFIRFRQDPSTVFKLKRIVTMSLQTKIVMATSMLLIIIGTILLMVFEGIFSFHEPQTLFSDALFQSITARTAGFNTVDIAAMSDAGKLMLILLMFIGGSPGSTAGGIKTSTFAVLLLIVAATFRKRTQVEAFRRSIRLVVLGRVITVVMMFLGVFLFAMMALMVTEREQDFETLDIIFETGSALGTVGLTTGITPELTWGGKLIIIAAMLIGRLGPLTLLASMTINIKPAGYEYPDEPLVVG